MIPLFNINNHIIDTSNFNSLLHDDVITEFEMKFANYVGSKYACSINSATNAIFLSLLNKNVTVTIPSMIPPVVANAILTSGNKIKFTDNVEWVGHHYVLHEFETYKIIDSAQHLEKNQFKLLCNPDDIMIFSFYPTKPLGGCDGGMIVTNDEEKYNWFKTMILNGTSFKHNTWEREIIIPGYKMYMNSIQAKILLNNFNKFEKKVDRLREICNIYNRELGYDNNSIHLYRIHVHNNLKFIQYMSQLNIQCGVHYSALHLHPVYSTGQKCPLSEQIQLSTVSLPFNEALTDSNIKYIISKTIGFK